MEIGVMALQNAEMLEKGVGWQAELCRDPRACEDGLCVRDGAGAYWHPAEPLAFAKWRVRARLADIPPQVLVMAAVRTPTAAGQALWGRAVVVGAVGLATAASALAVWLGRHGRTALAAR
jgi:hypothetical protein